MLHGNKYEHPIGGLFEVGENRRIAGQLKLKRSDLFDSNVVSIIDGDFFHLADGGSLHGVSKFGKVSLLDCVRGGPLGMTKWDDFSIHHGNLSFRYALFGKRHVDIEDKCIRGIQFTLDGVKSNVFIHDRFDRFGRLDDPDDTVLSAIERTRPEYLRGEFVKGKAMVSYFTGHWDFLPRFETVLGTVHVGRSILIEQFGPSMKDTPRIAVDFGDDPTTLEGAWEKMREIRQFFAWMMGYAPAWKDVLVSTSRLDDNGTRSDADGDLEVFAPNEWSEVPKAARHYGTLIDASRHPKHFKKVMTKWLERNGNASRKRANARFFGCIAGTTKRVMEDGIVSAANTFDLLPSEDKPQAQPLPDDVQAVLNDAKAQVRRLIPSGTQREEVLNDLGRILRNKNAWLRKIVEHRAEIVLEGFGSDKLEQLEAVIPLAIGCRNHYTHGPADRSSGDVDYANFEVVRFLTETLEFIYGASELLRCGWNPSKSATDAWHALGGYANAYDTKRSRVLGLQSQGSATVRHL